MTDGFPVSTLQTAFVFVSTDPLTLSFKTQTGDLQFNIFLNPETCQNLLLKVTAEQPERWTMEDTAVSVFYQKNHGQTHECMLETFRHWSSFLNAELSAFHQGC